jgi:hypothetical protein
MVRWYEFTPRPRLALALIAGVLYLPSLFLPFMIDDYRALRQFRDYREGRIERLHLYEFVRDAEQVRAQREAWYFPWWIDNALRFNFFRPVAERSLYLDFLLFGANAAGYRAVSLLLYIVGVWIVLGFYRELADERRARWAGLVYCVAGGHAIPIIFPSARCDLAALVAGMFGVLMVARFIRSGGWPRLAAAVAGYLVALGSKEVALGFVVAPPLLWWALRGREDVRRDAGRYRGLAATAAYAIVAAGFLVFYAAGSYASNGAMMLDPLRAPADYLSRAPGRAMLLLISWVIQINPFLFYFHIQQTIAKWWALAIGIPWLLFCVGLILRRHGRDRSVLAMIAWSLVFLPILTCTPADDRVMMIPSIGLAFVTAAWMTERPAGRMGWLRPALFLVIPIIYTEGAIAGVALLEWKANRQTDEAVASFDRPPREGDTVFFLNAPQSSDVLWAQDRIETRTGSRDRRVAFLTDVYWPKVERVGPSALRLTADGEPFLSSFIGRMGRVRGTALKPGERVDLGEYAVTVTRVERGWPVELLVEFRRPLDSDSYRFFELSTLWLPRRVEFTTTRPAS